MKFIYIMKKVIILATIYLVFDVVFFYLLPKNLKSNLYNNRAHRIKSFYYHHDLRPMSSFYDHWGYEKYKIFTNDLGFKDKSNRKVRFKKRNILFIGDSFTEGVGLSYEDTYVGIIESKLKNKYEDIEILNAGVQSYSTAIYLSKIYYLLENKKLPITDVVIMVSSGDIFDDAFKYLNVDENYILDHVDHKNKIIINLINFCKSNTLFYQIISRITPPKVIPELIKSLFNKKKNKLNYNYQENELMKISNEEISRMYFLDLKDYNYFFSEDEYKKWGKKGIDKSVKNLKKVVEITSNRNINLTILYLFEPSIILKKPNNEPINYLLESLKNLENDNSKFFVINHFYDEYKDKYESYKKLFFINDIHLNKKGNKLVADEILRKINF